MPCLKTPESRQSLALWLLWITPALWSVNVIVARTAPGVVQPHVLALGRWGLAGMGAYWAYGFSQKVLGLAAWGVLGEPMGWHHILGAGLILPGIYLASRTAPETPEP